MIHSILVICIGNVCRSPIGARLLQQAFPDKRIVSAGLHALVGYPADPRACRAAAAFGYSLEGHRAQQVTQALCHDCDLILTMEKKHTEQLCNNWPEVRGKIRLFGHWLNISEMGDPRGKSQEAFKQLFLMMRSAAKGWGDTLSNEKVCDERK